ncbi:toprim domain-containing protein [Methylobacterium sp. E-005]|uniref:toprim domain-containing protein n=1 Tax=Methylobacterium sp. E-005 TaxID=2836549 RepID=UPI001FBC1423|nr:toprim domain-containing protein [Methylobacterium sp. E-005]MCJ2087125.1 toprim domain-containing protein [Methylobacterium sp. E-005]
MFGVAAGTAIMFDRIEGGGGFLVVGEGIETTLTARQHLGLAPAWALGSSGAIASLPVLADVRTLVVLAENDANGASARAAEHVAARWLDAGRAVEVVWPPEGVKDLNDTVREDLETCR